MSDSKKINSGFAALAVVIIVGAAALVIALSTALLGVRELTIATTTDRGEAAKVFADGCLERALLTLRFNSAPVNYEFTDSAGRCIITMSDEGGDSRRIVARGKRGENEVSLEARVTTLPANHSLTIDSYTL